MCKLLDAARGPLEPPIRAEIFGPERFAQHGRSLAQTHAVAAGGAARSAFFPRLRQNIVVLREAHAHIAAQAASGYDISPAAVWLLDNFHLIEAQVEQVREGLPRSYFRALPCLVEPPLAGLPRVYGVAWAFVAHTDGAFDEELLVHFLGAYQGVRDLRLSETWALPTTLRVVLIECLRRLAERMAATKAAREVANLCCDAIEAHDPAALDAILALLAPRGVGDAFLLQMALRLQDPRSAADEADLSAHRAWLLRVLPEPAAAQAQQRADQTADNLSVSNAVTSLRALGDADWSAIVARTSALMRLMLGNALFEAEHTTSRDQTLHGIERLARRSGHDEVTVARALLGLMQAGAGVPGQPAWAGHWLQGSGRPALLRALDRGEGARALARAAGQRLAVPAYLGLLLLASAGLVAWMVANARVDLAVPPWRWAPALGGLAWLGAALMLFPASEAVVAVLNRLVGESVRPRALPRLALALGIPAEHRVLVVIPALLTDPASTQALVHRLHLHHLANPEAQAQFALLTDGPDADAAQAAGDAALLADAVQRVQQLNARCAQPEPVPDGDVARALQEGPRFLVLHRERRFSRSEGRWIGWERKRGKLAQLVATLAADGADAPKPFVDLGAVSRLRAATRYIVTLDSDTQLPPGRLRDLVGVAAHPHNQPVLGPGGRCVERGYAILQPRLVTPLPARRTDTPFHALFAGQAGVDPYSVATSEVYQDAFGEGSFTGKGLLHVQALQAVLADRLPEEQVLSHDLLEGSLARCAAVTDITLVEDAPFHADVAASRVHRWTRGDWQLLPLLLQPWRFPLRAINRWKMLDNLRRSLVAPMSLALLVLSLAGFGVSPAAALGLVFAAFTAGPLIGAVAGFAPHRDDVALPHFFRGAARDLARALGGGLWWLVQLLPQALRNVDAIGRAAWRMAVSRRHLLQWTTAAAAEAAATTRLSGVLRQHALEPAAALALLGALIGGSALAGRAAPRPGLALLLCGLWASAPLWTWWASRPRPGQHDAGQRPLSSADRTQLEAIARDSWRLFERCVGPQDHHLPPDNLQSLPHEMVARRTSPTNIGLYLLATACARAFGWIGTQELLARLEATRGSLLALPRHRGHFFNWIDTATLAPLLPMYVSTVDSGNLCGHLLAVSAACRERAVAPFDPAPAQRALQASRQRLAGLGPAAAAPALSARPAVQALLALADPLAEAARDAAGFERLLQAAAAELADAAQPAALPQPLAWGLADHLAMLGSAGRDAAEAAEDASIAGAAARLNALADDFEALAWQADFRFLYHRKRQLFHIGWRVAEQQLDGAYYDLLASEARLTSLVAIARGDVPPTHWGALGRPFFGAGARVGLRSWSGSMFEYLMPMLVLDEPAHSVLREACAAAVAEQQAHALPLGLPWGVSESAYAGQDDTLAYQYAPQGVPRLALRRTPADELVIAPYATALAAQIAPHAALANFAALQARGLRGRYGFYEALDLSPARQVDGGQATVVATTMAHHQGMSIVALANVLLDRPAQRWGMAHPAIEAVASLLHERPPREVADIAQAPPVTLLQAPAQRSPGMLRELVPGMQAVEPTQMLSNGRYHVTLRANGAGTSRRGTTGISRARDDALRDACGSFFYLRWDRQPQPVSITQHPAPDPAAHYGAVFHADRVCFDAAWGALRAHTTVWVSPEDDIEFRQVDITNGGERTLDVELLSAFDITLADPRADEAHPAFTNLFLRARWQASHQALHVERTPRLATEQGLHAAHFLADTDPQVVSVRAQADRLRWLGRNGHPARPRADFDAAAPAGGRTAPAGGGTAPDGTLDTGLDPVCALAVHLRIAPRGKARLTFATAACDDRATLAAVVDKYRQPSHVERASLMSATLAGIRLRALRMSAENFADVQTLTSTLVMTLNRRSPVPNAALPHQPCDRRLLWRFGIPGDRAIVLVGASGLQGLGLLRLMAQALRLWSWGGVACDLVIVNSEPASYQMPLQHELSVLRDQHRADNGAGPGGTGHGTTALHILRAEELSAPEMLTLRRLACLRLQADGRPLHRHVQEWVQRHERAFEARHDVSTTALPVDGAGDNQPPTGRFDNANGDFGFDVARGRRPPRPWINVLANPDFGTQVSEAGGGTTWARNSRLNQLTAWSNDPVADPPSEWFFLQDERSGQVWSVAPTACGSPGACGPDGAEGTDGLVYRVSHGQGRSRIGHRLRDLEVGATWCVDAQTSVKQMRLSLVNRGPRSHRLRVVGLVEWMLGGQRADRATVHTALHRQRLPSAKLTALLATQCEHAGGFGDGTAFFARAGDADETEDWTCDRRECFDARGALVLPDHFGQRSGDALDPCAALATRVALAPGETAEVVFLLGYADTPDAARQLAATAAAVPAAQRLAESRAAWDALLGATVVRTPDPLFDVMVNRWLLYQAVACRLWAKAGFYQAGGATGFRDQLQDAMALTWAAPQLLREQIVRCAGRQFAEGDVQHWWHTPGGAGVRTHFSDDLLWLPVACVRWLHATADATLLDEPVPFLEGAAVPEGAEDVYETPRIGTVLATVYEHAARAIDRSLRVGVHGLPLMGSGDWNDGMNRVGHEGRGESVWLGWFLCRLVADFAPVARERGDAPRAARWEAAALGWEASLHGPAWDGQWFKRAFFDDGQPLGSHGNPEARIDLIAQAWAVLSGAAPLAMQRQAMAAVELHLVDARAGVIRLLDPPMAHAQPSAGYIQAYPPGVRENGGQYAHAGVWALMANAALAQHDGAADPGAQRGGPDFAQRAWRDFTWLSPAHRAQHATQGPAYGLEPYVMAGDVYSQPPYAGRGGWSWYTGAAAWMHRAAVEALLGLDLQAHRLRLQPCLPAHWPHAEITLRRDGRTMHFRLQRAAVAASGFEDAQRLRPGQWLAWTALPAASRFVVELG